MNKILLSTATAFILSLTACSSHAPEKRVHRILTDRIQTLVRTFPYYKRADDF